MLVLSRKKQQGVMIGSDIRIVVISVKGGVVRLGVDAPRGIPVHRQEIFVKVANESGTE
jgi:carbon storage regulator|tara:strand:- start:660 stop:836 length:177 start_codon:yes stop_codon:yes gene_type:complete